MIIFRKLSIWQEQVKTDEAITQETTLQIYLRREYHQYLVLSNIGYDAREQLKMSDIPEKKELTMILEISRLMFYQLRH